MRPQGSVGVRGATAAAAVVLGVWVTTQDYVLFPQSSGLGRVGSPESYPRYEGVLAPEGRGGQLPAWLTVVLVALAGLLAVVAVVVLIRRGAHLRGRRPRVAAGSAAAPPMADGRPAPAAGHVPTSPVGTVGPAGDEVTRAWRRVEATLVHGIPGLEASRTSRSVLRRAVAAGAPPAPMVELADLYDRTRYSGREPVGADSVRAASLAGLITDGIQQCPPA
jgi:hypothetical protein